MAVVRITAKIIWSRNARATHSPATPTTTVSTRVAIVLAGALSGRTGGGSLPFTADQRPFGTVVRKFADRPGGEGGIRTHGGLAPTAVFKTAALSHSATSP